jgi:hypothetical protein
MIPHRSSSRLLLTAATALALAGCQDVPTSMSPADGFAADHTRGAAASHAPQELAAMFRRSAPEVLALPRTVFADHDEVRGRLVFGVENAGVMRGVQTVLARLEIPTSAYELQVAEPIHFATTTLRTQHLPTVGGIQIHYGNYVCTLGFNVDHGGGRSFVTNSHCTSQQGSTGNTAYYQPASNVASIPVAFEAHDPAYFRGGVCPRGRVCRYSDSSRALYEPLAGSTRGVIAKTTGENGGSLNVGGAFTITSQDNGSTTFSGTVHKVGRTTGWSSGNVTNTCATVNVSGANITLLCQTLVQRDGSVIVQGGDSGSPVFRRSSGDNVELVGILWGGNNSGNLFVFSPLKGIQDELGGVTATFDGSGGGTGGGGGNDGGGGDEPCVPKGKGNNCK